MRQKTKLGLSGALAGLVNGLFGGGGGIGGALGGLLFKRVSSRWLRRIFAMFLLYGGVRYLL